MKRHKEVGKKVVIYLDGPNGNAYVLLGKAKQLAKLLGKESASILSEMMSGNYEHLLDVFEREFGDFVILESNKF